MQNKLVTIISPMGSPEGVNIYQDAWFSRCDLQAGDNITYEIKGQNNGVCIFLIEGDITANDIVMNWRDGLGISHEKTITLIANKDAEILLMEVPI